MRAARFFTEYVAAKPINRIESNNYFLLGQNQPNVVVGGVARAQFLDLRFEWKQLRQLGRQWGLIAIGAFRQTK
jgi:hypothetical protein